MSTGAKALSHLFTALTWIIHHLSRGKAATGSEGWIWGFKQDVF